MAELILALRLRRSYYQRSFRRLQDHEDPFDLSEKKFVNTFRLSRAAAFDLVEELKPFVTHSSNGYPIEFYVLNLLSLMGHGSFQKVTSNSIFCTMHQSSLSRGIDKLLIAFTQISSKYITFPCDMNTIHSTKLDFFVKLGFPNVVGAIDCTHIEIKRPCSDDFYVYLNRKRHFSINVQMVCNTNLSILDVVARWPGSTHDSRIWQLSGLRHLLQSNVIPQNSFLLGDNGYPLECCLLTPYLDPISPEQITFNVRHRKARNVIERCFGVLKSRFRIFDKSGGSSCYTPEKVCTLIIVSAILHNICIKYNIEEPEIDSTEPDDEDHYDGPINPAATAIRDRIAMAFQAQR